MAAASLASGQLQSDETSQLCMANLGAVRGKSVALTQSQHGGGEALHCTDGVSSLLGRFPSRLCPFPLPLGYS